MLPVGQFRAPARTGITDLDAAGDTFQILLGRAAQVAFPRIYVKSKGPLLGLGHPRRRLLLLAACQVEEIETRLTRLIEGERQATCRFRDHLLFEIDRVGILFSRVAPAVL